MPRRHHGSRHIANPGRIYKGADTPSTRGLIPAGAKEAVCAHCGAGVRLNTDGRVRAHATGGAARTRYTVMCLGAGRPPKEEPS